jgi:hypothetical protein
VHLVGLPAMAVFAIRARHGRARHHMWAAPPLTSDSWRFERFGRLRSYVRPFGAEHMSAGPRMRVLKSRSDFRSWAEPIGVTDVGRQLNVQHLLVDHGLDVLESLAESILDRVQGRHVKRDCPNRSTAYWRCVCRCFKFHWSFSRFIRTSSSALQKLSLRWGSSYHNDAQISWGFRREST